MKAKRVVYLLSKDSAARVRWARGVVLWASAAMTQVLMVGWDIAEHWSWKEWIFRFLACGLAGVGGLISVGEKNEPAPTPPTTA